MDGPQNHVSEVTAGASRTVLCPGCGYDLRGMTGDRCSECGLVIDHKALRRSAFPWAHRKSVGRVRAFLKTVWLVTADSQALRMEAAKEQSVRDAARFARWVALSLSVCFVAVVVLIVHENGIREMAVQPPSQSGVGWRMSGWEQDLLVPWSAGIVLWPALFAYPVLLAFYFTGAPAAIFRARGISADRAGTVAAIGRYAAAPLFLVPLAALLLGAAALLILVSERSGSKSMLPPAIMIVAGILFYLLLLVAILGTVYRTGQWRSRTTDHTWFTGFLAMGELLLRWALGCVLVLGVVPWCVGFVWVVVDSLR
jgi:hypothetical protein